MKNNYKIEKNRVYNKTPGIIDILIRGMSADNLDKLFNMTLKRAQYGLMNYNEIRLKFKKDGYDVILLNFRESINIGHKDIHEVKKIFSYALTINTLCNDYYNNSFLSMYDKNFENEYVISNSSDDIISCIRRGLWEGMLTQVIQTKM